MANMIPKLSLALLSWKRIDGIKYIVNWAIAHELIDDVVVWNNNTDIDLQEYIPYNNKVNIINSDNNIMCYGRWLAVDKCKHDHVYVQDDDFIPGDFNRLYQLYNGSKCDIVSYCAPTHELDKPDRKFVGFGSVINKACVSVTIDRYINAFGEDSLFYRECDLMITNMNTYEKHVTNLDPIGNLPHDTNAMWRQEYPDKYHNDMVKRCKNLKDA